jgi:hypothetical protein
MKIFKLLLFALFALALVSSAFAEPAFVTFTYTGDGGNPPLGTPCTGNQLLFGDSVQMLIFWDSNLDGPTADDPQPPVGLSGDSCLFNTTHFNGEEFSLGAGYFWMDPAFVMHEVPVDNPVYWLRVGTTNPPVCWNSDTFRISEGIQEINMTFDQWHCVDQLCPTSGNPPAAPQNVRASDDLYCLRVRVSWDPLSSTQNAFNVYRQGSSNPVFSAGNPGDTTALFSVYNFDGVRSYYVKAINANGESEASNSDNGSMFLVRFAANTSITGAGLANHSFTVHFRIPPLSPDPCPYNTKLYLLHSPNGDGNYVRGALLHADSTADSVHFTLPNDPTLYNCRVLLEDSSYNVNVTTLFTDTTLGVFHLGALGADPVNVIPDHFELAQNFPNPFNPTTDIQFSVPMASEVRINIYNIQGQLVRTLAQGNYSVGTHRVTWDGKSDAGVDVGTGLYIYRMEGYHFTQAKKMLLMK